MVLHEVHVHKMEAIKGRKVNTVWAFPAKIRALGRPKLKQFGDVDDDLAMEGGD